MRLAGRRPFDNRPFEVITTTAPTPLHHARALAAIDAARAELTGLPAEVPVRWFGDLADSGANGFHHRGIVGVWLWDGLALEDVTRTCRHELLHLWAARWGVRASEEDARAFGDGRPLSLRITKG